MGEKVETGMAWWECSCGQHALAKPGEDLSRKKICPNCRSVMVVSHDDPALSDADETLRVDTQDMARIAQEGVDVTVSGEWDTTQVELDKPPSKDD